MTTSHTHLLEPISGDNPGGTDVSFSEAYDEIREARRQDDPSLAQGEWETSLKVAQWPRVKALSEAILSEQSKDIQVAAWYTEAMARQNGFAGLTMGLQVLDSIVPSYVSGFIYSALIDSFCSEQNARMTAMDAANKNAEELLSQLSLQYNRVRQAAITQEITEISDGAKAQKKKREKGASVR